MTMPYYIMDFYTKGAFLVWLVLTCLPAMYHIVHFVYRFVFDVEYSGKNHGFFRCVDGFGDEPRDYSCPVEGFAIWITWVMVIGVGLVTLGLALYFYLISSIMLIVVALMYTARGITRLHKALKKHVVDKNVHN